MIAKDLLAIAENVHKIVLMETQSLDEAVLVLNIANMLLNNDMLNIKPVPVSTYGK